MLASIAVGRVVSDREYQSVECRIKEILHESDRDRLVYTDGTDTSSVAPLQVASNT